MKLISEGFKGTRAQRSAPSFRGGVHSKNNGPKRGPRVPVASLSVAYRLVERAGPGSLPGNVGTSEQAHRALETSRRHADTGRDRPGRPSPSEVTVPTTPRGGEPTITVPVGAGHRVRGRGVEGPRREVSLRDKGKHSSLSIKMPPPPPRQLIPRDRWPSDVKPQLPSRGAPISGSFRNAPAVGELRNSTVNVPGTGPGGESSLWLGGGLASDGKEIIRNEPHGERSSLRPCLGERHASSKSCVFHGQARAGVC